MSDFIIESLMTFFKDEPKKAFWWLFTENLNLGGFSPVKLILMGRGHRVESFIRDAMEANKPAADKPQSEEV